MNFLYYAIKCVIRNIIYKLMKPQNLFLFCICLFIVISVWLGMNTETLAVYTGNDDYTDRNNTIMLAYNSLGNDLVSRLDLAKTKTNYTLTDLLEYLSSDTYGYYIFYNDVDGASMVDGSTYTQNDLRIAFYYLSSPQMSTQNLYTTYNGMDCSIKKNEGVFCIFTINNGFVTMYETTSIPVYMPAVLYNYRLDNVTNYLTNHSSNDTSDIITAINEQTQATEEQTQAIENQTQVVQDTHDFVTDDTISTSDGEMNIDTNGMSVSDTNGVNDFFTTFYQSLLSFFNNIDSNVVIIHIPLPYTEQTLDLRSDIISSHIQGTFIYTMIQTLWYFVFGTYFLFYVRFLIRFFSTGEFGTSGLAYFIEHLEDNDVIIRSTMM